MFQQYGHDDIREFKFGTYQVIYRVEPGDAILVLSVFHTQRDFQRELKRRKDRYL